MGKVIIQPETTKNPKISEQEQEAFINTIEIAKDYGLMDDLPQGSIDLYNRLTSKK